MFEFVLSLSKTDIYPQEMSRIKFAFKNTSGKVIHCLSYQFKSFWQDKIIDKFSPHEFFFNLDSVDEKEREFGDVNIGNTYLAGNTAPGEYEIKVWIRYFVCGEDEIKEISNSVKLTIKEEVKENVEV